MSQEPDEPATQTIRKICGPSKLLKSCGGRFLTWLGHGAVHFPSHRGQSAAGLSKIPSIFSKKADSSSLALSVLFPSATSNPDKRKRGSTHSHLLAQKQLLVVQHETTDRADTTQTNPSVIAKHFEFIFEQHAPPRVQLPRRTHGVVVVLQSAKQKSSRRRQQCRQRRSHPSRSTSPHRRSLFASHPIHGLDRSRQLILG